MLDPLAQEVRERLLSYLAGQSALRDLWQWLQANIVATGVEHTHPEVRELTGELLLYLYEYSSGHRTEPELRQLLLPILTSYRITGGSASTVIPSTSARVTRLSAYSIAA